MINSISEMKNRDAGAGGAGGARAPPSFGISVNPIRTKGADYARHITTVPPPHLFGRCGVSAEHVHPAFNSKTLCSLISKAHKRNEK